MIVIQQKASEISIILFLMIAHHTSALSKEEMKALKAIKAAWNVQDWPGEPDCTRWKLACGDDGHLHELRFGMDYKYDKLTGAIPPDICKLRYLKYIGIYAQRISGAIPDCIGDLQGLKQLALSGNCLGGSIPANLGKLSHLQYLDLALNHHNDDPDPEQDYCAKVTITPKGGLTGSIPDSLGNMKALQHIELSDNLLRGAIPESMGNLSSLVFLSMNRNNLSGTKLPKSLGKLKKLQSLLMNSNGLIGQIPKSIGHFVHLQTITLTDNKLTGTIPEFREDALLALNLVDLRNNMLNGSLPSSFERAPLRYLLVSNNKDMTGPRPSYIGVDWGESSIVNETFNYECPGLTMDPKYFHMNKNTVVQLDPEYYNYSECYCRPGFYGNPPYNCVPCVEKGHCPPTRGLFEVVILDNDWATPRGPGCMGFDTGYFPVHTLTISTNLTEPCAWENKSSPACKPYGLEPCAWQNKHFSACNPNGTCAFCKTGLTAITTSHKTCKLCADGYEGRLCSKCTCRSDNISGCYFRSQNECVKCTDIPDWAKAVGSIIYIAILIIYAWFYYSFLIRILLVMVIVILLITLDSSSWLDLDILIACIILIPATSNGLCSGFLKAFILYLQTVASIGQKVVPHRLSYLFNHLQFINLKFMGIVCLFPGPLGESENAVLYQFLMSLCAPFAVLLCITLFLILKGTFSKCRRGHFGIVKEVFYSIIFITYFAFFNTAQLVISVFNCVRDSTDQKFMSTHPHVKCGSEVWHKLVIAAIIGTILFIIMPFVVFTVLLYKNKHRLDDDEIKPWLGTLYLSYIPKQHNQTSRPCDKMWMYNEIVFMVLRLVLAASIAIPPQDNIWRAIGIAIVLIIFAIVFILYKPYTNLKENRMGYISVFVLIITLFSSTQLGHFWKEQVSEQMIGMDYAESLQWFTLVLNVLLVLTFISLILWTGRDNLRENWEVLKDTASNVYMKLSAICNRQNLRHNVHDIPENGGEIEPLIPAGSEGE